MDLYLERNFSIELNYKDMKKESLIFFVLVTFGFARGILAQVPNYIPTNGLVGWWPFSGNANDESGNGNNGTVNGATLTTDRFGLANKAYSFDGMDDDIIIDNEFNFDFQYNFSISLWVNSFSTDLGQKILVSKFQNYDDSYSVALNNENAQFNLAWAPTAWTPFQPTQTILPQIWNQIIVTFDSVNIQVYINGFLELTSPYQNTVFNSQAPIVFGNFFGNNWSSGSYFNGFLDDIGIWNRALSPQEISDLYNSTICVNDLTISPSINSIQTGNTANFTATTSDANSTFTWQSDFGQGYVTLNDYGNYSGTSSNTLSISNVQLANHNQPIRAISSNTNCTDTSNAASIQIADTCITTVFDTLLTTVTDTLVINTTLSLLPPNNENTILIYPNPASDHITIDNGNYAAMAGYTIKIENNAGQQVFQSAVNQPQFYIDLSTWSGNGLYFIHLIDPQNNTVTIRKIVIQ
jgi:hypothetical protein